jgi:FAD dependent oxidoreductase TIGR03364
MRVVERVDLAIVGSGILGLGAAAAAIERGLSVAVVERRSEIQGASVRNFGHIATTAQAGAAAEHAAIANERWRRLADRAGFWLRSTGTLVVARHADELAALEQGGVGRMLTAAGVVALAPVLGSIGGAHLPDDLQVDPRSAAAAIAAHLADRGVRFHWRTSALGVEPGMLHTARGTIRADAVVVAVGHDVDELYPDVAEEAGVVRCALDMLAVDGVGLEIPVLTGSSLLRYGAFAGTDAVSAIRERFRLEQPELLELDINQMATERPDGTMFVGDTHHRGAAVPPFQRERDADVLHGLARGLFDAPLRIRERWQGVYASAPNDLLVATPADGVRIVSVTTGIGMTVGLGLSERVVADLFDPIARGART